MTLQRSASIADLRTRALMLERIREFFAARDVLEVETPGISAAATPDPALQSLRASGALISGFLHTSPEYLMKRLLADGSGDIYQLCRVYRDGEHGSWHEPEFTLLEWYRCGIDEHALMDEVDALLTELLAPAPLRGTAQSISYDDALHAAVGLTSNAQTSALAQQLEHRGIEVPPNSSHDDVLDLAMATVVSGSFPQDALTFVYDYPATQAALARIRTEPHPVAARFEVFLGRLELGNGFNELTDAAEQRARFERENSARIDAGLSAVPIDEEFLSALNRVPECSGVALGFDRVVAAALGADSLAPALAFRHSRADF